ncbi:MAG: EAL domain-containing protein [Leptolyngbyaceae cyanobacterium bins.349]|nr:EAL domain-containing protein [Leptolyngbyaceae cyanobacterium bins.349]
MVYSERAFLTYQPLPNRDRSTTHYLEDATLFISHELRTPLTSIQGVLGLLYTGQLGELSEEGQRLLAIALENTNRLTRLATAIEREIVAPVTLLSSTEMEQLQLENDLHHALLHHQFQLVYQPIMQVEPTRIISFEALLRWQHPIKGEIPPTLFIPLAEQMGIIAQLGLWVLDEACQQLAHWQQQFPSLPPLSMSVNLSALQLLQPDLLQQVKRVLQETSIAPNSLKLEITETALIENQEFAAYILSQLRSMGVQVYIDDFGTGYSSLARLQDLPIDALKIDRSFVRLKRWDISETIITLATKLGLDVIAEGVETAEDAQTLTELGCHQMQGYFFSKPMAPASATRLIAHHASPKLA